MTVVRNQGDQEGWCGVLGLARWGAVTTCSPKDGEGEVTQTQGQRCMHARGRLQGLEPLGEGHSQAVATLQEGAGGVPTRPLPSCPAQPEARGQRRPLMLPTKFTYKGIEQDGEGPWGVLERQREKSSTGRNIMPPGSFRASGHPYKVQKMVTTKHSL